MIPQLLALAAAVSYAICMISARRGLKHSTAITVTLVSLIVHTAVLWTAVFLTGGIPEAPLIGILWFAVAGTLQPIIRLLTYSGIALVGVSRSSSLRATAPLFSAIIAIAVLEEEAGLPILMGTVLVVVGIAFISRQPQDPSPPFRWRHLLLPLGAALLGGINHPVRRYALTIANEPLFFAAIVGLVSLIWYLAYLTLPTSQRPVWNRRAIVPFVVTGLFETLGILLGITALSVGTVVVVTPIIATSPVWVLLGTVIFLRDIERLNLRIILGGCCVVGGTMTISLWR